MMVRFQRSEVELRETQSALIADIHGEQLSFVEISFRLPPGLSRVSGFGPVPVFRRLS